MSKKNALRKHLDRAAKDPAYYAALQRQIEKAKCERSFYYFVSRAWHLVDPTPFCDNWHIFEICNLLEAITRGEARNAAINIPPRHGKPCHVDEMVWARRGRVRLGDVRVGDCVLTHLGRFKRVQAVHEQGVLPVLKITTHSGRVLRANDEHPFLTPRGWVQAQHLTTDDVLAVVSPAPGTDFGVAMPHEEARLLGYFVGDGSCKEYNGVVQSSITCFDEVMAADIFACCAELGFRAEWSKGKVPGRRGRINVSGGVRPWLKRHGLSGLGSRTKRVPAAVMNGTRDVAANFIAAYLGCDGWVGHKGKARRDCVVEISSVSRDLLADVQHLYVRLGINSRLRTKRLRGGTNFIKVDGDYLAYTLGLTTQTDVWRFQQSVPLISEKGRKLKEWAARPSTFATVLLPDPIVSIERDEPAACRCLTVADDHSFTIGDVAVHNSLIVSVLWPAWVWTQKERHEHDELLGLVKSPVCGPSTRFLCASYDGKLSMRDNVKTRTLIQSGWYQDHWGDRVTISEGENLKTRFDLASGGFRLSTSPTGMTTGEGGDVIILDDPLSVVEAASDQIRNEREFFFTEVLPSRRNDQKRSAIVLVQQRIHERDTTGIVLAKQLNYIHLCLPAMYDPGHPHIWHRDPRTEAGELLFPQRFGVAELEELTSEMTEYAIAGQLQQLPAPREGGLFKRHWFEIVPVRPAGIVKRVRAWDLAATEESFKSQNPAWTAGVLMSVTHSGYFYIEDVFRFRGDPGDVEATIRNVASLDGPGTHVRLPQDPGQAGKAQVQYLIRQLAGFRVNAVGVSGSKIQRAEPLSAQAKAGNVKMVRGAWNEDFLSEACSFPNGQFKDQIDAAADAFNELAEPAKHQAGSIAHAW